MSNVYTGNGAASPTAFNNAGTLEKTAGSGTTTIDFLLNNTAATLSNTSTGSLELSGGGTIAGSTIVNGTVGVNSSFNAAAGSTIAAPSGESGGLQITGGTFSLAGTVTTSIVTIAGGALNGTGSGTLASGSQVTWTSGTVEGTLTGAGTMDLTGTGAKSLSGTLTNAGTLTISGSSVVLTGTLTNSGTVDVTGAGTISVDPSVATINNQAGATFDFQADATLSNVYTAQRRGLSDRVQQRWHAGDDGRLRHHHDRFPAQQHCGNAEQRQYRLAGALRWRDHRRLDHRERHCGYQ